MYPANLKAYKLSVHEVKFVFYACLQCLFKTRFVQIDIQRVALEMHVEMNVGLLAMCLLLSLDFKLTWNLTTESSETPKCRVVRNEPTD